MAEELILIHHGIKGQKWGVRRFQNRDGSLTGAGKRRYSVDEHKNVSDTPGKLVSKTGQSVELQTIPSSRITNFLAAHNRRLRTNAENTRNFKIKADGKVVGDLQLFKESKDSLNVTWVGVNESERGHGYATAAMLGSIEIARRSGCRYVTLEVPGNSPDARHVYEKLGFVAQKQISSDDDAWGGLTSMKLDLGSGEEKLKHSVLIHHGIKGQKWGVRNGPPYPLGADDKSAAEKKAASSHHSRKADTTQSDKFWTDERKTKAKQVAKGVAITAAVVLAAYGGYKLSQMPTVQEKLGRKVVEEVLTGDASQFVGDNKSIELSETLEHVNPLRGKPEGKNNCTSCGVACALQQIFGIHTKAISTDGKMQNLGGVIEDCFRGARVLDGSAESFTNRDAAAAFLVKRFGDNAEGVVGVQFRNKSGHTFNWKIVAGNVLFYDGQVGIDETSPLFKNTFLAIDPHGGMTVARLDNATPLLDRIANYVLLED